jgi:quercetin dioxygenase-like cupin family protein
MGFHVYDYRTDNLNVFVSPELRARLYHMAPGQVDGRHSHDLGHEVFLILEGRAAFEIAGETKELGPGQLCIARADEIHQVRNLLPDQPTIMYLSVTPHIHPTHTGRTETDERLPPRFAPNRNYHVEQDMTIPLADLIDRHVEAAQAAADAARLAADAQQAMAIKLKKAIADQDQAAAEEARNAMWASIYTMYKHLHQFGDAWNELAPRITAE